MKVFVIMMLMCCSFVYNLKTKNENMDLAELENGFGNSARFAANIFSDKSKYNK